MKIPDKIEIVGLTIQTEFSDTMLADSNNLGEARYCNQKIILASEKTGVAEQTIEQTYIHELTHYILHVIGENELTKDEEFVVKFSNVLYQIINQLCD